MVFCQLMGASQDASLYLSSFSIVLISADRFIFICNSHNAPISTNKVIIFSVHNIEYTNQTAGIYLCFFLGNTFHNTGFSTLVFHQAKHHPQHWIILLWGTRDNELSTDYFVLFLQSWSSEVLEHAYSWSSIFMQFLIPSGIVTAAYTRYIVTSFK